MLNQELLSDTLETANLACWENERTARVDTLSLDSITAVKVIDGSWWTHARFIIEYQNGDRINKRRIRLV